MKKHWRLVSLIKIISYAGIDNTPFMIYFERNTTCLGFCFKYYIMVFFIKRGAYRITSEQVFQVKLYKKYIQELPLKTGKLFL